MSKLNDLTGQTFGLLTARERVPSFGGVGNRSAWWICDCACGAHVEVRADRLRTLDKTYCEPSRHLDLAPRRINPDLPRHRYAKTYHYWEGIMAQKTIAVCHEWHQFDGFLAAMGERQSRAHSLRRNNRDIGYEPGNCVWYERNMTSGN